MSKYALKSLFLGLAVTALLVGEAHASGGGAHPTEEQVARLRVIQITGFALLALILWTYVVPIVSRLLAGRTKGIADAFEAVSSAKEKAAKERHAAEGALKGLDRESEGVLNAAFQEGVALKDKLIAEADGITERIRKKSRLETELERAKMVLEAREEVRVLAFAATQEVLAQRIDEKVQDELIERFLTELDAASLAKAGA